MLTKRTHILFDIDTWRYLKELAEKQKTSVGTLVRTAVKNKYRKDDELSARARAIDEILRIRPKPVKGKIDYKALINYGRKH